MKHVLILGAGMVSAPLVHYLLDHGYSVALGDINVDLARKIVGDKQHAKALAIDMSHESQVREFVAESDLVISLLPPSFHSAVARIAIEAGVNMLTASYVSEEMRSLDEAARAKDLIIMNEVGLDPGLDHMTIMDMMDDLKAKGYRITHFSSHCGGIPARKAANNAVRYKFSWNPAGVLGALTRPSKYIDGGTIHVVPGEDKLKHAEIVRVPGAGIFESMPNKDSMHYAELYGLDGMSKVRRGTLRYPGWAGFWLFMLNNGFVDRERTADVTGLHADAAMMKIAGKDGKLFDFVKQEAEEHASVYLEILENLGMFLADHELDGETTTFDIVLEQARKHLNYEKGETDLVVLYHEFVAEKDGKRELWSSSMVREGKPEGMTAMSELVGIPSAITARLILEDKIQARGVLIPVTKEIYAPVLAELEERGVTHQIQCSPLDD